MAFIIVNYEPRKNEEKYYGHNVASKSRVFLYLGLYRLSTTYQVLLSRQKRFFMTTITIGLATEITLQPLGPLVETKANGALVSLVY